MLDNIINNQYKEKWIKNDAPINSAHYDRILSRLSIPLDYHGSYYYIFYFNIMYCLLIVIFYHKTS